MSRIFTRLMLLSTFIASFSTAPLPLALNSLIPPQIQEKIPSSSRKKSKGKGQSEISQLQGTLSQFWRKRYTQATKKKSLRAAQAMSMWNEKQSLCEWSGKEKLLRMSNLTNCRRNLVKTTLNDRFTICCWKICSFQKINWIPYHRFWCYASFNPILWY